MITGNTLLNSKPTLGKDDRRKRNPPNETVENEAKEVDVLSQVSINRIKLSTVFCELNIDDFERRLQFAT